MIKLKVYPNKCVNGISKNNLVAEPIGSAPRSYKNVPWQPRLIPGEHSFSYYPIGFLNNTAPPV